MNRRRAILVGVEGGIGHAIAHALAEDGCDLGLTWFRDEGEADRTASELQSIGARTSLAPLDLAAPEAAADIISDLAGRLGGLDILVGSAGHNESPPEPTEFASFRRVVEMNLIGMSAVLLAGAAVLTGQNIGGRIVVVTSVHEDIPLRNALGYTAAKHGLGGLVKGLALELAPHGITVNSVAPGPIATRMTGHEGERAELLPHDGVPAGRYGAPGEVAAVVRFLASPQASYVTGSRYGVDGGMALMAQPTQATVRPGLLDRAISAVARGRRE